MNGNISAHIQAYWETYTETFQFVDQILANWTGVGCYKLPTLLEEVAVQFDWTEEQFRAKDPIVRDYLRSHPLYFITRGARGGIGRRFEKDQKEARLEAKKQAKKEVEMAIEAEIARKQALVSADELTSA
jgi:hypothetical protein